MNTGPSRKRNDPSCGSKMSWPMTSDGIRSGVNCTRLKSRAMVDASAFTSNVLAVPGTPSSSTWPPASRLTASSSNVASWPTSTRPASRRIAP